MGTISLFLLVTAFRQYAVPESHIDVILRFSPLELRDSRSDVKYCSVETFGVLLDGSPSKGATSLRKDGASLILTFDAPTLWNQWYFETPENSTVEHDPVRFVLEAWEPDGHVSSADSIGASSGAREAEGGDGRCSNPRGGGSDAEAMEEVTQSCSAASGRWRTIGSSGILSFRRTRTFFHSVFPTRHGAREIHDYSLDVVGSYVEMTRIAFVNTCLLLSVLGGCLGKEEWGARMFCRAVLTGVIFLACQALYCLARPERFRGSWDALFQAKLSLVTFVQYRLLVNNQVFKRAAWLCLLCSETKCLSFTASRWIHNPPAPPQVLRCLCIMSICNVLTSVALKPYPFDGSGSLAAFYLKWGALLAAGWLVLFASR